MSGREVASALEYKKEEAAGRGIAPTVMLRRLTHSQYNNTVHDLLREASSPASEFPPEDFVNGFKNQYESLSLSPIQTEAYSLAAAKLAANAFRRGDSRGLLPCPASSMAAEKCRIQFIETFGTPRFPPPAHRRPKSPATTACSRAERTPWKARR